MAENTSRVIQVVWQLQRGCRTYCYGTSQTQTSFQWSETSQNATAISEGGSSATARNESSTVQFVWQTQIGCVAFCYGTSQIQEASQHAVVTQEALARSALTSWAENLANIVQYVFQTQRGCEHECHGTSQSQTATQSQATSQSATGSSAPPEDGDGVFLLPDWLIAYARNFGATIQVSRQYQEALCMEQCTGDIQIQYAEQHAGVVQHAVVAPPPAPPVEQPPAAPANPAPSSAPSPEAIASPIARRVFVLGRTRARSTEKRRELVFRLARPRPVGGSPVPPAGPAPAGSAYTPADTQPRFAAPANPDRSGGGAGAIASATSDQWPATTTRPLDPPAGGSVGWLAILFVAGTLGLVTGFSGARLRRS